MTHPPRVARRLLRAFVPADVRDSVDGDIAELHASHVASRGRVRAVVWYWTQTLSFAARFSFDRVKRGAHALASVNDAASSLDVRLSTRLLVKHPGLTLIAGFGIAAAIGISAAFFAFITMAADPTIPLDEGERIVGLENWNIATHKEDHRAARDFVTWREDMRTVIEMGAFRNVNLALETGPASAEDIRVAAMTASGFRVARIGALLGRTILPDDERPDATPVLVIGYDVWRMRFAGDSSIVGRHVRLDETLFTIVGVMPPGFAFPMNHQYWTTLRMDPSQAERGTAPDVFVFGRLAPGATMQSANAELAAVGRRVAAAYPKTNGQLRPQVLPYTYPLTNLDPAQIAQGRHPQVARRCSIAYPKVNESCKYNRQKPIARRMRGRRQQASWNFQRAISLIVIVVALNVAILVYARTAARRAEIAVRTALGASRRRIVGQLFVEALTLSLPPAVLGLVLAQYGLRLVKQMMVLHSPDGRPPFWMNTNIRPVTAVYALGLALVIATIVGVLPALKATGRGIESDLRQLGGATGMRLGKLWTTLVVAQVAFAVGILPPALNNAIKAANDSFTRTTYPATEFTSGVLTVRRPRVAPGDRTPSFGARLGDVERRLRSNPAAVAVSFLGDAPTGPEWNGRIEVEGMTLPIERNLWVRAQAVDTSYLELYGARLLTGRHFVASDLRDSARVLIVNRSFVRRMLGGRPALGRRLRYVQLSRSDSASPPPWFEIVGVVEDLRQSPIDADLIQPMTYHALAPERLSSVSMIVRTKGPVPSTFGKTVYETIAATDPDLRLGTLQTGENVDQEAKAGFQIIGTIVLLVVLTVLLLTAAGVYALMAFTVTQRRREIGIRAALGASQRQVLIKVFSRAARQIGAGVAVGAVASAVINATIGANSGVPSIVLVPIVAIIMIAVGLGAAYLPTRRGLSIEPVEALRSE